MCSSTRGPASAPSFVTCPTSTSEKPRDFASRISSKLVARTCPTVPGALSIVSSHMVWILSITTSARLGSASSEAAISRTLIAAASCSGASSSPKRCARIRTWSIDSSPEIYSTRRPLRATAAAACSISVDLPIPGSPPTSTTEAGTNPPPSTRSSSAIPAGARGGGAVTPCSPTNWMRAFAPRPAVARGSAASSTSVFHSPHASHLPAHFEYTAPQD